MNAGKPPSNAIINLGARPPTQRWHSHSELRKNKPIPSPKIRMPISPPVSPNMPHPRTSSGQSSGHDSNCRLRQMSRSEGMCARLKVLVSSRHNGPAFVAVSTSSIAEKAVPSSAAEVSVPSFPIRFNDMRFEIERRNCRPSIRKISAGALDSHRHFAILGGDVFMTRLRQLGEATPFLRYLDWVAAIVVTLCAAYLHALFFLNAGGLWRDEAAFVHLSLLPS